MISPELSKRLALVAAHPQVQKNVVRAMFDCMTRGDTGVSDIWEYIEDDSYPEEIANILFEEEGLDPEAIELLISNVQTIVLDGIDAKEASTPPQVCIHLG